MAPLRRTAWSSILLLITSALGATAHDIIETGFSNEITNLETTSSPIPIELPLKLSFEELHMLSDYIVEIGVLGCPMLNTTAARSFKAFMRDRVQSSPFKELHKSEFHNFTSQLNKCHGELIGKGMDLTTTNKPKTKTKAKKKVKTKSKAKAGKKKKKPKTKTTMSTTTSTSSTIETTTVAQNVSSHADSTNNATSIGSSVQAETTWSMINETTTTISQVSMLAYESSTWNTFLNWVADAHKQTYNFFTRILRGRRDLRNIAIASVNNNAAMSSSSVANANIEFDHTLQAKQNFEEMIHALRSIVKRACIEINKYDNYLGKVEEELLYWIRNYKDTDIIYLSDSYFSISNLLPLARKCAAAE